MNFGGCRHEPPRVYHDTRGGGEDGGMNPTTFGVVYFAPDNSIKAQAAAIADIDNQIERGEQWVRFVEWGGTLVTYRAARIDGYHISTPESREACYALRREMNAEEKAGVPDWESDR
jgi:hypothetical protein